MAQMIILHAWFEKKMKIFFFFFLVIFRRKGYIENTEEPFMGLVKAEITLKNTGDITDAQRGYIKEPEIRQTTVTAMVDTGAATLVINEAIRRQLGLNLQDIYVAELADGSVQTYNKTEAVQIQWKNRDALCRAILIPNASDVLLGAIPLEEMDLIINPLKQELIGAHGDQAILRV